MKIENLAAIINEALLAGGNKPKDIDHENMAARITDRLKNPKQPVDEDLVMSRAIIAAIENSLIDSLTHLLDIDILKKYASHIEFPLAKTDKQKRIDAMREGVRRDKYIVVSERDCKDPLDSTGPIVHETRTSKATLFNAYGQVTRMAASDYGRSWIFRLVPVENLDEVNEAINT